MPSFDIVSEVDLQEVDNAVNQVARELETRFDFRGGKNEINLNRGEKFIEIIADDELKLRSIHQILETKFAKRNLDCRTLIYEDPVPGSAKILKQKVTLKIGLSKEDAKLVTKKIKDLKTKVQAQIQDDQVRVTGKQIDDLQKIIAELKGSDLSIPLQFINMRS